MQVTRRRELTRVLVLELYFHHIEEIQDNRRRELTHEQLRLIRNQLGR